MAWASTARRAAWPNGLPGFVTDKFTNLTSTISAASAQIDPSVGATVQGYVNQAQTFFNGGVAESASNGFSCAMNSLASADAYVRANLPSFSGLAPPGNPNPAGEIDGRLANLFLPIDLFFLIAACECRVADEQCSAVRHAHAFAGNGHHQLLQVLALRR